LAIASLSTNNFVVRRKKVTEMRRLIISTLVSLVGIVPAVAQVVQRPAVAQDQVGPKLDQQEDSSEIGQSVEATLLNRLASAGFTDIEMTPISFAVRAKDADGNPCSWCFTRTQTRNGRSLLLIAMPIQRAHTTRNTTDAFSPGAADCWRVPIFPARIPFTKCGSTCVESLSI
jgi:hypothetical protein